MTHEEQYQELQADYQELQDEHRELQERYRTQSVDLQNVIDEHHDCPSFARELYEEKTLYREKVRQAYVTLGDLLELLKD